MNILSNIAGDDEHNPLTENPVLNQRVHGMTVDIRCCTNRFIEDCFSYLKGVFFVVHVDT